jgi:hypothetical protein
LLLINCNQHHQKQPIFAQRAPYQCHFYKELAMTNVFEGNNLNSGIRELNAAEIEQVSGGVIPAAVWAAAKFCGYAFGGGFFGAAGASGYHWLEGYFLAD